MSADPNRRLIGDDEHGWSPNGVFNIEGGCYAKCINLSREKEPQIFDAIRFGSVLENVVINLETRVPDYDDSTLTENTRAAYPIQAIDNIVDPSVAGHPNTIIFLTADAFGVLPPIAKLTKEQAMYHFLSGYTSSLPEQSAELLLRKQHSQLALDLRSFHFLQRAMRKCLEKKSMSITQTYF